MNQGWFSIASSLIYLASVLMSYLLFKRQNRINDKLYKWVKGKGHKKPNIYVFDDDVQDLELIERNVLSKIENNHQVFVDQQSILQKAKFGKNVFVIDNFSPGMSGVELTQKIKIANSDNWVIVNTGAEDSQVYAAYSNVTKEERIDRFVSKNGSDADYNLLKAINEGIIIISNQ